MGIIASRGRGPYLKFYVQLYKMIHVLFNCRKGLLMIFYLDNDVVEKVFPLVLREWAISKALSDIYSAEIDELNQKK